RRLAEAGATVVCGGLGGVMAAACHGAAAAGGRTVGILPGTDRGQSPPDPHVETAIFTGLGQARNLLVVLSGDAVIAVGGGWGTLSEIALARKHGRPVVQLAGAPARPPDGRADPGVVSAATPEEAVTLALRMV
ncbi:MAG: LOG family protein, partial [Thermoanaerobaculia bacterium]